MVFLFVSSQEAITKKQEEMFRTHENSIMQLISGSTTLTNQRLDSLSKEIADLKESLEFNQEETEGKFNKLNEKITTMEKICSASRKTLKSCKPLNRAGQ